MGMLCGLIMVLAVPSIRRVLICTNKSSTPRTAYRRYIKTIFHILEWHENDLKANSRAWKSICMVNKVHGAASRLSQSSKCGMITQKDMVLTQFGFMGLITLKSKLLGISTNDEFLQSTVHFWRVIGFLMGIEDQYNICTDSWETTKPRLEIVLHEIYKPFLTTNDSEFLALTDALIDGLWSFNPFLTSGAFLYFTKRLAECDGYEYLKSDYPCPEVAEKSDKLYKTLSWYNRFVLCFLIIIHQYLYIHTIGRLYYNSQIVLSRFLIYYFPFLAYHRFGWKGSYVRIFKKDHWDKFQYFANQSYFSQSN